VTVMSRAPLARLLLRCLIAIVGGYQISVGLATLLGVIVALVSGGARMDAFFTAGISFSLIFCGVLIWAFWERRLWLMAAVTFFGAWLCFRLAAALEPAIRLPT